MIKRVLVLIALGIALAALTILRWNMEITIPFFGLIEVASLISVLLIGIALVLALVLARGLLEC
jgi:hypothetical protein